MTDDLTEFLQHERGSKKRCIVVSVLDIEPLFTNIFVPVIVTSLSATRYKT